MDTNLDQHGLSCENCGRRLLFDGFETYCEACGLVVDANAFETAPVYKTNDDGHLVGQQHGPPTPPGIAPSGTVMSLGNYDARGHRLPDDPAYRTRLARMRRV